MSELALKLIKKAKEQRLTRLNLGNCGLTELPNELFELIWLEELILINFWWEYSFEKMRWDSFQSTNRGESNDIKYFNPKIKLLKNLKKLFTYGKLNDLSPLKNLSALQLLFIDSTQVSDLSPLKNLSALQVLNINSTQVSDLNPLKDLRQIQYLSLDSTKVSNLSPLKNLSALKLLSIDSTQVSDLNPLKDLRQIQYLSLNGTKVSDLSLLKNLKKLEELRISNTLINELSPLKGSILLHFLDISYTQVNDLNPLKYLPLRSLYASFTNITDLTPMKHLIVRCDQHLTYEISEFSLIHFDFKFENTPLDNPPKEIANEGFGGILHYWEELEKKETVIYKYSKVIFIGNSQAGKTSLWRLLKDKIFKNQLDSTHGIKTEIWDTEKLSITGNQKLGVHIWDFGGQEYYHATHRLFLVDTAIYILVWEKDSNFQGVRTEKFKLDDDLNNEIETVELEHYPASYWLEVIRYFGGTKCPILIVQNKVDTEEEYCIHTEGVPETADCFHLSVKNAFEFQQGNPVFEESNLDFQRFKMRLLKELRKNATAFKLVKYYAQVREALEAKAKNTEYIAVSELKDIALQFDETPDLENLLAYLKSFTNTVLYFPQNEVLSDRLYLNPTHISRDIYKILNKTVRENKGKFNLLHIKDRLNLPNYEEAERFLALMHEFDMIFEKHDENDDRAFIAPQYLQQKAHMATGEKMILKTFQPAFYLRFKFFVPRSMMLRFIAQNGASAYEEFYWRNGIVYQGQVPNTFIKVEYDSEARTFAIEVQDKDRQAVDMQQVVKQFVKLNNSDDNIEISNDGKTYIELKTIRKLQHENRRDNIFIEGNVVSLDEYDWLIKKLKTNNMEMTLEELKEKVLNLISKAKIKEAMDEIASWAFENNQEQLKSDISLLKGDWTDLSREKLLGLLSNSQATLRQNQLVNNVLTLVNSIENIDKESNTVKTNSQVASNSKSEDKPKIYFSYAWGDDHETGESREKLVFDLYESLKNDGFEVFRDKENSGYRDLLSNMMKDIGRGQFIVVAISDKYLKSPNCMFELYEIYRNSKLEKDKFIEKIFPIRVESIRLSDPKILDTYFEHWEQQEKEWADLIIKRGTRISPAQQERYKRIKTIASELGEFLELLSDINTKTKEDLSKNNFEEIKQAIKNRIEKN